MIKRQKLQDNLSQTSRLQKPAYLRKNPNKAQQRATGPSANQLVLDALKAFSPTLQAGVSAYAAKEAREEALQTKKDASVNKAAQQAKGMDLALSGREVVTQDPNGLSKAEKLDRDGVIAYGLIKAETTIRDSEAEIEHGLSKLNTPEDRTEFLEDSYKKVLGSVEDILVKAGQVSQDDILAITQAAWNEKLPTFLSQGKRIQIKREMLERKEALGNYLSMPNPKETIDTIVTRLGIPQEEVVSTMLDVCNKTGSSEAIGKTMDYVMPDGTVVGDKFSWLKERFVQAKSAEDQTNYTEYSNLQRETQIAFAEGRISKDEYKNRFDAAFKGSNETHFREPAYQKGFNMRAAYQRKYNKENAEANKLNEDVRYIKHEQDHASKYRNLSDDDYQKAFETIYQEGQDETVLNLRRMSKIMVANKKVFKRFSGLFNSVANFKPSQISTGKTGEVGHGKAPIQVKHAANVWSGLSGPARELYNLPAQSQRLLDSYNRLSETSGSDAQHLSEAYVASIEAPQYKTGEVQDFVENAVGKFEAWFNDNVPEGHEGLISSWFNNRAYDYAALDDNSVNKVSEAARESWTHFSYTDPENNIIMNTNGMFNMPAQRFTEATGINPDQAGTGIREFTYTQRKLFATVIEKHGYEPTDFFFAIDQKSNSMYLVNKDNVPLAGSYSPLSRMSHYFEAGQTAEVKAAQRRLELSNKGYRNKLSLGGPLTKVQEAEYKAFNPNDVYENLKKAGYNLKGFNDDKNSILTPNDFNFTKQ